MTKLKGSIAEKGSVCRLKEADIYKFLLCAVLIVYSVFAVHWNVRFRGVYSDDYGMWRGVYTNRVVDYIFSTGANKIRPIPHALMFLTARISDMNSGILGYWLLTFHLLMTLGVFVLSLVIARSCFVAFVLSMAYQVSRFSYYHVTQFLGVMETTGMVFAIAVLMVLFFSLKKGVLMNKTACLCYFCAAFSHERYMVLLPVLLYAALCVPGSKQKIRLAIESIVTCMCIVGIRMMMFGNRAFDGTGGTDIKDTFSFVQAFGYAVSQLLYLFGWNAGPEYLNGYEISDYSNALKSIIVCMDVCILLMCIVVFSVVRKKREYFCQTLKLGGLFFVFIAVCIASSSTTIRVELRWIYVSFTAMLLLIAYLYSVTREAGKGLSLLMAAIISMYGLCSFLSDAELKSEWKKLYFGDEKGIADSLYDHTYGEHGVDFWNKNLVLIDVTGVDVDETRKYLMAFPKGYYLADQMNIYAYRNIREVDKSLMGQDSIILYMKNNKYVDFSESIQTYEADRVEWIDGFDESGWIGRTAEFAVYTRDDGQVTLLLHTDQIPDESWKQRMVRIYADDRLIYQGTMDGQDQRVDLNVPSNSKVRFRIENSYSDPSVEIRGTERCYILRVSL